MTMCEPTLAATRDGTTLDLGRTGLGPRRARGMPRGTWLEAQLFEHRIVLVSGRLDDASAAPSSEDIRRGRYLDSTEAVAYELVDEITAARGETRWGRSRDGTKVQF